MSPPVDATNTSISSAMRQVKRPRSRVISVLPPRSFPPRRTIVKPSEGTGLQQLLPPRFRFAQGLSRRLEQRTRQQRALGRGNRNVDIGDVLRRQHTEALAGAAFDAVEG